MPEYTDGDVFLYTWDGREILYTRRDGRWDEYPLWGAPPLFGIVSDRGVAQCVAEGCAVRFGSRAAADV